MLDYCFQRIDQKAVSIDALVDQPTDGATGQQDQAQYPPQPQVRADRGGVVDQLGDQQGEYSWYIAHML